MNKNIPNILTTLRLILTIPLLILFHWVGASANIHLLVLSLTILAALTDWFDGWYARKFDCVSEFGKIYDPLADKWLAVIYLPLVYLGMIHFLPVALLWIRDITSTYIRSLQTKAVPARLSGKIKTAISFPLLCLLIAAVPVTGGYLGFFSHLAGFLYWAGGITLSIVCVWSGIDYYYQIVIKGE